MSRCLPCPDVSVCVHALWLILCRLPASFIFTYMLMLVRMWQRMMQEEAEMRQAGNIVLTSGSPIDIWALTMLHQWGTLAALISPDPAATEGALRPGADQAARIAFLRSRLMPVVATSSRSKQPQQKLGAAEIAVSAAATGN